MFLSEIAIKQLRDACEDQELAKFIGLPIWYFTLIDNHNGVASVDAVITRAQPGEDRNGPFTVDIGIDTTADGIYYVLKELTVMTLGLERRDGSGDMTDRTALCLAVDLEEISEIINKPRYGELSLVPKPE